MDTAGCGGTSENAGRSSLTRGGPFGGGSSMRSLLRVVVTGILLPVLLEGKRILVTGVLSRQSIAFRCAELAQQEGAEILLTSFGRVRSLTEKTARRLDPVPDILELDI